MPVVRVPAPARNRFSALEQEQEFLFHALSPTGDNVARARFIRRS
jgi:hypothetical protein